MRKTKTAIICIFICVMLVGNLTACGTPEPEQALKEDIKAEQLVPEQVQEENKIKQPDPEQALEGIWVKQFDPQNYTVLTFDTKQLTTFYIHTNQEVTEKDIVSMLNDNPAYYYTYTRTGKSLKVTETNEAEENVENVEYGMELSIGKLVLESPNDRYLINGVYKYVAPPPTEGITAKNANNLLQEIINGTWIKDGNAAQGFYQYTILSIRSFYSNIFSINTTLNLNTGTYSDDLGFSCFIMEDGSIADSFYDFMVLSNRTVQIKHTYEANPYHINEIAEGIYNIMVTNDGILITSQDNPKDGLNGNYYKSEIRSTDWEGAWASTFNDYQSDGLSRYYFDSFENGIWTSSERTFSRTTEVDHSKLLKYFKESKYKISAKYKKLEGGLVQCSGVCSWPVYVTDKLWIIGYSGGPNDIPKYWSANYKLDISQ